MLKLLPAVLGSGKMLSSFCPLESIRLSGMMFRPCGLPAVARWVAELQPRERVADHSRTIREIAVAFELGRKGQISDARRIEARQILLRPEEELVAVFAEARPGMITGPPILPPQ